MGWYDDYPDNWDEIRKAVYKRDGYTCQSCGRQGGSRGNVELHCHHITPKTEGGSNHPRNLVTLCWRCHNAQHDHYIQRMSDISSTSNSSRRSQSTGSVGHDPESMDAEKKRLRDLYMSISGQGETADNDERDETVDSEGTEDDQVDIERELIEHSCPNCTESIETTGWFSLYCHFEECEFPSERPSTIPENKWQKIQDKRDQYQCPTCGETIERKDRLGLYQHFRDCELPSERPDPLSKSGWIKLQSRAKIEPAQPPQQNSSSEGIPFTDGILAFLVWFAITGLIGTLSITLRPTGGYLGAVIAVAFYVWQKSDQPFSLDGLTELIITPSLGQWIVLSWGSVVVHIFIVGNWLFPNHVTTWSESTFMLHGTWMAVNYVMLITAGILTVALSGWKIFKRMEDTTARGTKRDT